MYRFCGWKLQNPKHKYPEEGAWVWNEGTVSWVEYIEPTYNTE